MDRVSKFVELDFPDVVKRKLELLQARPDVFERIQNMFYFAACIHASIISWYATHLAVSIFLSRGDRCMWFVKRQ